MSASHAQEETKNSSGMPGLPSIDSFLNTANIVSGKPYTSRGVRAVWEGGDASPVRDELNLTS